MADCDRPAGLLGDLEPEEMSDGCCWACSGGGDVVCCDSCRAVYHLTCIGLQELPEDDWFCPLCTCCRCSGACRGEAPPPQIRTRLVRARARRLPPQQQLPQPLPAGPGYLGPQQVRLWLQQQQQQPGAAGGGGALASESDGGGGSSSDEDEQEEAPPAPKRRRSAATGRDAGSSGGSAPPPSEAAEFVRCCCCQRACHTACLPDPLRQQYAAAAAARPSEPPAGQLPPKAAGAKRQARPRARGGKKQQEPSEAEEEGQQQQQQQWGVPVDPYYCSPSCQQVAMQLARRCAQGLVQVDALLDGTPICWQLVQPAAVAAALAAPRSAAGAVAPGSGSGGSGDEAAAADGVGLLGTGAAAGYSAAQAGVLARVVRDAATLMAEQLGPAWEVRSFQDTLPWLLGGLRQATPGGLLDLSHVHVAVMWVGGTLAAAALVRVHGTALLEVLLAATLGKLQHKRLGRMLAGCVERWALDTLKVESAWMPALGGVVRPSVGVSVLPSWERAAGAREVLSLTPGCSVQLLGLQLPAGEQQHEQQQQQQQQQQGPNGTRATASAQEQQQQQQRGQAPSDTRSCWALQLRYGPAPSVADWLQLPKHALLRFSYVPFVTKALAADTVVPLPSFGAAAGAVSPAAAGSGAHGVAVAAAAPGAAGAGAPAPAGAAAPPAGRAEEQPQSPTPEGALRFLQEQQLAQRHTRHQQWQQQVQLEFLQQQQQQQEPPSKTRQGRPPAALQLASLQGAAAGAGAGGAMVSVCGIAQPAAGGKAVGT